MHLAKVADLKVISRTSVMQYRNVTTRNVREIAHELGVVHVLEGSVQRAGDRVRVSAQMIDARTDTNIWADHYDRNVTDVFALESDLAQQIVSKLKAKLSPQKKHQSNNNPPAISWCTSFTALKGLMMRLTSMPRSTSTYRKRRGCCRKQSDGIPTFLLHIVFWRGSMMKSIFGEWIRARRGWLRHSRLWTVRGGSARTLASGTLQ